MNICKCGKRCEKEYCFKCKSRKSLSKGTKTPINNEMYDFFRTIWSKRPHRSEISNTSLGNEILTIFFHHILLKSKTPEAMYDESNIILLSYSEHQTVHSDMYKYEEINKRREELLIKYKI